MKKVHVPQQVKDRVQQRLVEGIAAAELRYGRKFDMPSVNYDKGGTVAGTANYYYHAISCNSVILMENTERYITRTVPHELAHLITAKVYPETIKPTEGKRTPHGPRWQEVMRVLGVPEDEITRTHSYDVSNAKKDTDKSLFKYTCVDCNKAWNLTARRHGKMQDFMAGRRNYWYHCDCGSKKPLQFAEVARHAPSAYSQTVKLKRPEPGSKLYNCWQMYNNYVGRGRSYIIDIFINECDCTRAGAATYYATCKKLYDANVV